MLSRRNVENLIVVAALQEYAYNHNISKVEAFDLFEKYGVFSVLRNNYDSLHLLSLEECAEFADDIITRKVA